MQIKDLSAGTATAGSSLHPLQPPFMAVESHPISLLSLRSCGAGKRSCLAKVCVGGECFLSAIKATRKFFFALS